MGRSVINSVIILLCFGQGVVRSGAGRPPDKKKTCIMSTFYRISSVDSFKTIKYA